MHATQLVSEARLEQGETHGTRHLAEGVVDETLVHPAHEFLVAVSDRQEGAGGQVDLEGDLVEFGLETGVVEVLVQCVDLMERVVVEAGVRCAGVHAPQQVTMAGRLFHPTRGFRVGIRSTHREIALGRAPARAPVPRAMGHQPLGFEHDEVIPHGVLVQPRALGELAQQQPRRRLDLGQQPQPAGLGESAEVVGATGHEAIITDVSGRDPRPWSRIVSEVSSRAVVVTVSDRSARGERVDAAGPIAVDALCSGGFDCDAARVVPDGAASVSDALRAALADGARLVITTGGTGVAPRDATPEGTAPILTRTLPGISEELRRLGAAEAPGGLLSRGVAGIVDPGELSAEGALIVNLPGSPAAVTTGMPLVLALAQHVLDQLGGGDHP